MVSSNQTVFSHLKISLKVRKMQSTPSSVFSQSEPHPKAAKHTSLGVETCPKAAKHTSLAEETCPKAANHTCLGETVII